MIFPKRITLIIHTEQLWFKGKYNIQETSGGGGENHTATGARIRRRDDEVFGGHGWAPVHEGVVYCRTPWLGAYADVVDRACFHTEQAHISTLAKRHTISAKTPSRMVQSICVIRWYYICETTAAAAVAFQRSDGSVSYLLYLFFLFIWLFSE